MSPEFQATLLLAASSVSPFAKLVYLERYRDEALTTLNGVTEAGTRIAHVENDIHIVR